MIRSVLSMHNLSRRSRSNAEQALLVLRATGRDNESAQQAMDQARRKLAMQNHPSFVSRRAGTG